MVEGAGQFAQQRLEGVGKLLDFLVADAVKIGALALGINRHLERGARGVGAEDGEAVVLVNQPGGGADFLAPDVLEDGALPALVKIARDLEFLNERGRQHGQRDQLADRMQDLRPGLLAHVLYDEECAHPPVAHEVQHPDFPGDDDFANGGQREGFERVAPRGFDDDFVRADSLGAVVEAVGMPQGIAFHPQRRGAIGNDADLP